jgi:hypothetical protein
MQKVLETLGEALSTKDTLISYYKSENERLQKRVDEVEEIKKELAALKRKVALCKRGEDEE